MQDAYDASGSSVAIATLCNVVVTDKNAASLISPVLIHTLELKPLIVRKKLF